MTTKDKRAEKIEEAVRLTWDSLQSHLRWTHKNSSEGRKWHQKCVKEYVRIIELLTHLY